MILRPVKAKIIHPCQNILIVSVNNIDHFASVGTLCDISEQYPGTMALVLHLKYAENVRGKADRIAKVSFRGR